MKCKVQVHDGEHFHLSDIGIGIKAVGTMDAWLGGRAPSELRRVGRLGDGWLPSFCTPDEVAAGRVIVDEAAERAGRQIDPEHFGALVIYTRRELPERLARAIATRRPGGGRSSTHCAGEARPPPSRSPTSSA